MDPYRYLLHFVNSYNLTTLGVSSNTGDKSCGPYHPARYSLFYYLGFNILKSKLAING